MTDDNIIAKIFGANNFCWKTCILCMYSYAQIVHIQQMGKCIGSMDLASPQTHLRTVGDQAFCAAAAKTWKVYRQK